MHDHQNAPEPFINDKRRLFTRTVERLATGLGDPPPKLSVTVLEALLVGVASNIDVLETKSSAYVRGRFKALTDDSEFSETALREGLSKKVRVTNRLTTAKKIFAGN
jgi:hypothetical protein